MTSFAPIEGSSSYWYDPPAGVEVLNEENRDEITELLMGRTVEKVSDDHLLLDDGTVIRAIGHDGGCACSAGCYDLTVLNRVDNVITSVEFDYAPAGDYDEPKKAGHPDDPKDDYTGYYRIFVLAGDERINLHQVDGTDGNGYYGTGFQLLVRRAS